jgi:hypothetical protein
MRIAFLLLVAFVSFAQTNSRTVTLTWTDTANPVGTTYSVYRATGTCSGTPTFTLLASGVAVKTYTDSAVPPGNYCYAATATSNAIESDKSTPAGAQVRPFAPGGLNITVQ